MRAITRLVWPTVARPLAPPTCRALAGARGMGSQHPAITDDTIFPGLGLNEKLFSEVGSHRRGRQHVNPLKLDLMSPPGPMDWPLLFSNPHLPLVVDVGSGYGRFCLAMAKVEEEGGAPHNYLGVEIRDAVSCWQG